MATKPVKKLVKEDYTSSFSGRLRWLRRDANFTQPALSRVLGISTSYINLLETGERANPTIETVDRICAFFGVRREWLLDGVAPQFLEEPAEAARERFYSTLRAKVGEEGEQEIREQQLIAEISVRIAQLRVCSDELWKTYRKQIIAAIDAHAIRYRKDAAQLDLARRRMARAERDAADKRAE
jgi:transcriptional regulator with XRE-family HTH domain